MQDRRTEEIIPIETAEKGDSEETLRTKMDDIIPRQHQGAILEVGEIVELKGGKFRVHAIKRNRVILKSVPSA